MFEYLDRRYALAYYNVAEEKQKVDEYIQEFREIVDLINTNVDLSQIINNPKISSSKKMDLVSEIFNGKVNADLISFINVLLAKKRMHTLGGVLSQTERIYLEKQDTILALVKTVIPLKDDEKKDLALKLKAKYNKNILLQEELDKDLIGGVYVKIGDDIMDGTIKYKLNQLQKLMLKDKLEVVKE